MLGGTSRVLPSARLSPRPPRWCVRTTAPASRPPAMFEPRRVLRWVYIGRLSVAAAIFIAAAFVWQAADAHDTLIASLALIGAIAFTALSVWFYAFRRGQTTARAFYGAQAVFDVA